MKLPLNLILIVIVASILAIALVVQPADAAPSRYWGSVGWVIFLVFLNWFTSVAIFASADEKPGNRFFGALPGINLAMALYSLASLVLLALFAMNILPTAWHIGAQIFAFASITVVCLMIVVAAKSGGYENTDLVSKDVLLNEVERIKAVTPATDESVREALQTLQHYITNEMPHPTKLNPELCRNALTVLQGALQSAEASEKAEQLAQAESLLRRA